MRISIREQMLLAAVALVFLAPISAHATNLILDGSFENPVIPGPWYENFGTNTGDPQYGGPTIPGWTITTNNVDIVSDLTSTPKAADGNQYLDLVGNGTTGGISQSFDTKLGQTYTLSFEYGNNAWSTGFAQAQMKVGALSALLGHNTSTTSDINWTSYTGTFVGDGDPMTLSFLETYGYNYGGVLLDDISVTATPLPAALPLFAGGLGILGLLGRRRRKSKKQSALAVA